MRWFLCLRHCWAVSMARWDRIFDETIVDRLVNVVGSGTRTVGNSLRVVQTGRLRQYITFIAIGVVGLFFVVLLFLLPRT